MLPMASQVVAPPVRDFNSPSSLVCGHSLITLMRIDAASSSLCGALPWLLCLVRCSHSHGSRVTNSWRQSSNVVVWLPISCPVLLSLPTRHTCMISFSNFSISASINILFFFKSTRSSSNSRSLRFLAKSLPESAPVHPRVAT